MALDTSKLQCVKIGPDRTIQAACPVCRLQGSDKTGVHLKIWPNGAFNCAKAGKDREHNRAIRRFLKDIAGSADEVEFIDPSPRLEMEKVYPESMLAHLLKDHSYWLKRGAKEEVMEMLEGGVSAQDGGGKLANRYVIPIRGVLGQINGFSGRILTDSTYAPKYKHLFKSSKACWPWHLAGPQIEKTRKVVLNEGWSEFIFLAGSGITNTLSLFGLNLNSIIIKQLIATNVEKVIISTNNDPDETINRKKGKFKALEIKKTLEQFFPAENVIIRHPKSDWGEATEDERQEFKQEIEAL
jgi:hypothetical protein